MGDESVEHVQNAGKPGRLRGLTLLSVLCASALGGLGGLGAFTFGYGDGAAYLTNNPASCANCHVMQGHYDAWVKSSHHGVATCNDCHLPHDNSLHYFFVKAKHGVMDPMMEIIKDPEDIDWHGNRQNRERFVYDSGCLSCHKYLQEQTQQNPKAFRPHRDYFAAPAELSCVGCHEHVGHHRLGYHLEQTGWPQSPEESP